MSNDKNTIEDFLKEIPDKLDSNKTISLYDLMLHKCPLTIKQLNKKINDKKFLHGEEKQKWYTLVLNYLVKENILEGEKTENGTIHKVNEDWKKYFLVGESTVFSLSNASKHLILYSQIAKDFLIASGFLNKEGKELFAPEKEKKSKGQNLLKKYAKPLNYLATIVLFVTFANFVLMVSRYGIKEITPFLSNTCLFTLSSIIICTGEKK